MEEKLTETNPNSVIQIAQLPSLASEEFEQDQDQEEKESFEAYEDDITKNQRDQTNQDPKELQDVISPQACSQYSKPDSFQNLVEMLEKVETLKLLSQTAPCDYYRAISEQCSFRKFTKGNIIFLKNERQVGFYGLIEGRVALWQPKNHVEIEEELKQLNLKKSTLHSGTIHSNHHSSNLTSNNKSETQKDEQFQRILAEGNQGERFFTTDERKQNIKICNQKLFGIFGQGSSFNEQEVLTGERAGGTLLAVEDCLMVVIKREEFTKIFAQQILKLRFVKEVLFSVFGSPGNKKAAESLERVSGYFREFQFEYQNTIFEEGAQSDEFYVIYDGEIQKFHALKNASPSSPLAAQDQISNELPLFPSSERRIKRSETKGGIIAKGGLLGLSDCILNIPRNHSARCISARASLFAIKRSKFLQVVFDNEDYGLLDQVKKLANAQQKLSQHLSSQPSFVLGPELTPKRIKEINSPSQLLNASLHSESKFRISSKVMSLKVNHNRQASLNPEKITDKLITDDLTKDQEPSLNQGQQQQQQLSNNQQNKELLVKPKPLKLTEQIKQIYESHQNSADTPFQDQENAINVQTKISNSQEANEFMPDVERFKQRLQVNMTIQRYRDSVISNEDTPEFHKIKQQVSLQRIRKPKPPTFSQTSSRFFQTWHHKEEKQDQMQETNNNDEELQSDQHNTSINGTLQFLKKDKAIEAVTDTQWSSARNAISRDLSIGLQPTQQESPGISQIPLQVGSLREILLPQMLNESKSPMQNRLKLKVNPNSILSSSQTSSNRIKQTSNQIPRKISNISQINMFALNQEQEITRNSNNNSNPGSEGLIRSERNIHFTSRSDRKINSNISNSHLQLPSQFAQQYHKTREGFQLTKNLYSSTCLSKRAEPDLGQSNLKQDSQDQQRNPRIRQNTTEQQDEIKPLEYQPSILIGKYQRLLTDNNEQISPFDPASPATPLNDTSLQFSWKNPLSTQLQDLLHPLNSTSQPTLPQKSRFIARQNIPRNGTLTQGEISSTNKSHINESLNFSSAFDSQASYPASCKVIPRAVDENNLKNVLSATIYNSSCSVLKPPSVVQGNSHKILISQNFRNSLSPSVVKSNDTHEFSNNQPNQQQDEAQKRAAQHSQHSQFRLLNRILKKKQSQILTPARLSQDLSENERQQQEQLNNQQQTQAMKKESQKSVERALPFTNSLIKEKIKQLLQGGAFNRPLPAYQPSKETYSQSSWQQRQQQQSQPQSLQYQSKGNQSRMTPQPSRKQQLFLHSKSFKQITDERQPDIQATSTQKLQILSIIHAHDNLEKINNTIGDFEDTLSPVDWKQRGFSQGRIGDRQSKTPMHQNFSKSRKLLKGFSGKIGFDTP